MQAILGRRGERGDVPGGEGGDEQRSTPDVEHGIVERHLDGSVVREAFVDVVSSGIHNTTSGSKGVATLTAVVPSVATTPPYSDAATLSA